MILFYLLILPMFLILAIGGHYLFYKVWASAVNFSTGGSKIFIALLAILGSTLFVGNILTRTSLTGLTTLLFIFAYLWMAILIYFTVFALFIKLIFLGVIKTKLIVSIPAVAPVATVLAIITVAFGIWRATSMTIPHYVIRSDKVVKPIRIMHITDVHFSPVQGEGMALQIEDIFHRYKPDIIISTGDLLDRGIKDRSKVVKILSSLKPPAGKFACTGNHEFISDISYSEAFHRETGFRLLRNEVANIIGISIAGVDDPLGLRMKQTNGKSEMDVVRQLNTKNFRILLKHQPRFETSNAFELQLSGHTHGGQFFPFSLFTRLIFKYNVGKFDLNGTTLIVGAGTGTWGPYIRVGIPPEIIIIDLLPEKTNQ